MTEPWINSEARALLLGAKRRYCGRAGIVLALHDGQKCPECGWEGHKPLEHQSLCGNFVPNKEDPHADGFACLRPAYHSGPCMRDEKEENDGASNT